MKIKIKHSARGTKEKTFSPPVVKKIMYDPETDTIRDTTGLTPSYLMYHKGVEVTPMFSFCKQVEDFQKAGVQFLEPMTATEIDSEEDQNEILNNGDYIVEEKFDGTRGLIHFFSEKPVPLTGDYVQSLLRHLLQSGSNVQYGKDRIYKCLVKNSAITTKEVVDFLKKEFGTGGRSFDWKDIKGFCDFDSSGFKITIYNNDFKTNIGVRKYSWSTVASIYAEMIRTGYFYPSPAYTRVFSRRVSTKTNWLCENTDLVPQIRDICIPELDGTVIDGELFIPDRPFKDIASVMNCTWDKAIQRQLDLGYAVLHAFDILFYKGEDLRGFSLQERKKYLKLVVDKINSPYIEEVKYFKNNKLIPLNKPFDLKKLSKDCYPTLYKDLTENKNLVTAQGYYESIVALGGEGVIVKSLSGKYFSKRGREYQKIKKFLTREVIILGFAEPTKEYKGKFPNDSWDYWEHGHGSMRICSNNWGKFSAKELQSKGYTPVTKYYCEQWVGNIRFGVYITPEEFEKLPKKSKTSETYNSIIEVGECSGFDEETRKFFTDNREMLIGKVIEVKANELFKDTGKMRHPRFLRMREDKNTSQCTWKDHINSDNAFK